MQVEDLEPGIAYRFRVSAVGTGNVSAPSAPVVSPAVPEAPGAPEVVSDDASVVELQWEPAAADGGSAILGHRLLASYETPSYVSPWLPLVANSSSARTRLDGVAPPRLVQPRLLRRDAARRVQTTQLVDEAA